MIFHDIHYIYISFTPVHFSQQKILSLTRVPFLMVCFMNFDNGDSFDTKKYHPCTHKSHTSTIHKSYTNKMSTRRNRSIQSENTNLNQNKNRSKIFTIFSTWNIKPKHHRNQRIPDIKLARSTIASIPSCDSPAIMESFFQLWQWGWILTSNTIIFFLLLIEILDYKIFKIFI